MKGIINMLITSVGRRTCLLKYFKKELEGVGNLVAADCSFLAPALYEADKYYIVPRIDDLGYIEEIKKICLEEEITAILSLIDPELSVLAKHSEEFKEIGVRVVVSSYMDCELWLDKYAAAQFCKDNGFNMGKTYNTIIDFEDALEKKEIDFPVFIKPRRGSASFNIHRAENIKEAKFIFESFDEMIIQELMKGQELGVDAYVDMITGKVVSIFAKEKISMRAGETDKARSIRSEELFKLIQSLVEKAKLSGPIDVDVFSINGNHYISEINPRFGGGYPLAYECGINFPRYIINNLRGIGNEPVIGSYKDNVYMMKHDSLTIKRVEQQ